MARAGHRAASAALLIVIALVGIGVRVPFVLAADCINSDAAMIVLMARHFARGEVTPFLWGQRFMGPLEPFLLTPLAWGGLATPLSQAVVAVALIVAQAAVCVVLARRWGGIPWVAALLWTVPSTVTVLWDTQLGGARSTATLLALCALAVVTGAGGVRRRWLTAGLLIGIAFYGDHLMVMWGIPLALLALREAGGLIWLIAGALPPCLADAGFALWTTGSLIAPQPPGVWLRNIALLQNAVPALLGADWLSATNHMPGSTMWYAASAAQAAVLIAVAVGATRLPRNIFLDSLKVIVGTALILFVLTARDRESVRYLIPAWPAVTIMAAVVVARWRFPLRLAVLVVPIAFAHSLANQSRWATGRAQGAECRDEARRVEAAMRQAGVAAAWTDYWTAFRFALLVDERIPFAPFTSAERRPEWVLAAHQSHPVGYLIHAGDAQALATIVTAARATGASIDPFPIHVGSFDLLVLPATLPDSSRP